MVSWKLPAGAVSQRWNSKPSDTSTITRLSTQIRLRWRTTIEGFLRGKSLKAILVDAKAGPANTLGWFWDISEVWLPWNAPHGGILCDEMLMKAMGRTIVKTLVYGASFTWNVIKMGYCIRLGCCRSVNSCKHPRSSMRRLLIWPAMGHVTHVYYTIYPYSSKDRDWDCIYGAVEG